MRYDFRFSVMAIRLLGDRMQRVIDRVVQAQAETPHSGPHAQMVCAVSAADDTDDVDDIYIACGELADDQWCIYVGKGEWLETDERVEGKIVHLPAPLMDPENSTFLDEGNA